MIFLSNIAKVLSLLLLHRLKSILGFLLSERTSRVSPVIFSTRWGKEGPSGGKQKQVKPSGVKWSQVRAPWV